MKSMSLRVSTAAIAAAFAFPALAAPDAAVIDRLEKQVQELQRQIQELRTAQQKSDSAAAAAAEAHKDLANQLEAQGKEAVVKGDIPGSTRRAGEETSIRVYGFAELTLVHDFAADNGSNDYSTFAPYMPLEGAKRKGQTYLTARTSRFGIETSTPTAYGPLGIHVEGDFNNDPRTGNSAVTGSLGNIYTQQGTNSYDFRLRLAYAQFGPWMAGQNWSTFMDLDSLPETVDFNGPIGATFIRQPQIRYTYVTPDVGNWTAALENSVSYVLDDTGVATKDGFSRVPDLVLRWDKPFDWGSLSLRGVTHEMRIQGDLGDASKRGYGLAASGTVKTRGDDYFGWTVTGGNGIGRYFNYIEGAIYDPAAAEIRTERAVGVVLGYQLKFSDYWRSNLAYGYQRNFDNDYTDFARQQGLGGGQYGVNRSVQQAHAGFFWSPVPKLVDLGAELIWARRETLIGEKGSGTRLNLSGKFYFN